MILPGDHIPDRDLAQLLIPEIRQDLRPHNVLLREPCVELEPRLHIRFIQFPELGKVHVDICLFLDLELPLPLVSLFLGGKTSL